MKRNFILFPNARRNYKCMVFRRRRRREKCVDYIMISMNLEDCIDFEETICSRSIKNRGIFI